MSVIFLNQVLAQLDLLTTGGALLKDTKLKCEGHRPSFGQTPRCSTSADHANHLLDARWKNLVAWGPRIENCARDGAIQR